MSIYLTQMMEVRNDIRVMYFFCTSGDSYKDNAAAVLRSFLWQMTSPIHLRNELTRCLLDDFETPKKREAALQPYALWRMLEQLLAIGNLGPVGFVLDGLDECDHNSQEFLANRSSHLVSPNNHCRYKYRPKVLVVSRDIRAMKVPSQSTIRLDPGSGDLIRSDVEKYVAKRVAELGLEEDFSQRVEAILLKGANKTFLWVSLMMGELQRNNSYAEIEESLNNLPKDLPQVYSRMLGNIRNDHREKVAEILRWVALGIMPMTLKDLSAIVGIEATKLLTAQQKIKAQVIHARPFLVIQKQKLCPVHRMYPVRPDQHCKSSGVEREVQTVAFIHESARGYLLHRDTAADTDLHEFRIDSDQANFEMAWCCLDFIHKKLTSNVMPETVHRIPFLEYAIRFWAAHAKNCGDRALQLQNHPSRFFDVASNQTRKHLIRIWKVLEYGDPSLECPFFAVLCYLGVVPLTQVLLDQEDEDWQNWVGDSIYEDWLNWVGDSILGFAVSSKSPEMVNLVLQRKASTGQYQQEDQHKSTPLRRTRRRG